MSISQIKEEKKLQTKREKLAYEGSYSITDCKNVKKENIETCRKCLAAGTNTNKICYRPRIQKSFKSTKSKKLKATHGDVSMF